MVRKFNVFHTYSVKIGSISLRRIRYPSTLDVSCMNELRNNPILLLLSFADENLPSYFVDDIQIEGFTVKRLQIVIAWTIPLFQSG